jgi:GT2 family glycosyltransferase
VFVPFDPAARVVLAVVALGTPERLVTCVTALRGHESRHDFAVVVVRNEDGTGDAATSELPDGVLLLEPPLNLGWAGGLHLARAEITGEYFVWIQDDMVPDDGWLDELVAAADAHPRAGAVGSVSVDDDGVPVHQNAGRSLPADQVERWATTDVTAALPTAAHEFDWVTSRGLLTRTEAWDELSGADPTWFPLNYVDLDFTTHLRAHGWAVYLAPAAHLRHARKQSAPSVFREFLGHWQRERFNQRWGPVVAALAEGDGGRVDHPCAAWRGSSTATVSAEEAAAAEATRLVVPFARFAARKLADVDQRLRRAEKYAWESRRAYELERDATARLRAEVADLRRERAPGAPAPAAKRPRVWPWQRGRDGSPGSRDAR